MDKRLISIIIISISILFTSLYAYFRYFVFGVFTPTNFTPFIINKASIFSAIILILFISRKREKVMIVAVNILISLHIFLSLYMLAPDYFPKLFNDAQMINTSGILLIGFGLMSAIFFFNNLANKFIELSPALNNSLLFIFVIAHNISIGWRSWLQYQNWNGGMPPITLLTSLILSYSLFYTIYKSVIKSR